MALRIEPPTGPCYYQTPAMRATDYVLPGELVALSDHEVAIKKPNGKYLTVLYDGTDQEHDTAIEQETFRVEDSPVGGKLVLTADRMAFTGEMADKGGVKSYWISVIRV